MLPNSQRQRYLSQRKPPPWLLCGTWDELVRHHEYHCYPTPKHPVTQENTAEAFWKTKTRVNSTSNGTATKKCPSQSYSANETSVVAFSHMTEEDSSYSLSAKEDIKNIMTKYLAVEEEENRRELTNYVVRKANEDNDEDSAVSQTSERKECRHYGGKEYEYPSPLSKCFSTVPNTGNNLERRLETKSPSNKVFQGHVQKNKVDYSPQTKSSTKQNKAPPFRKIEQNKGNRVDPKLRDQLLVEIQYGRDRLRPTPTRTNQVRLRPLTSREQLMQEIRSGMRLRSTCDITIRRDC